MSIESPPYVFQPRYLNYVGRTDSALTLPLISRDPTPCMAETAMAMVNLEVGLDYWLPWDTHQNYSTWGVPWQPVVQPHLDVYHRQGRLGHHVVVHPHQELQHVRAEHLGADCTALSGTFDRHFSCSFWDRDTNDCVKVE